MLRIAVEAQQTHQRDVRRRTRLSNDVSDQEDPEIHSDCPAVGVARNGKGDSGN